MELCPRLWTSTSKIYHNCKSTIVAVVILSTSVNAECDKLATVVGCQFIILSVHLCVQHHGRKV